MKVCEFSRQSVQHTRREFYISRLGSPFDLKFSPELDIVKNLIAEEDESDKRLSGN